jgi:hypothetical protein
VSDDCEIGRIKKVHFGVEDHGVLGLCIDFDFGSTSQSYGWFALAPMVFDEWTKWTNDDLARNMRKLVELYDFLGIEELSEAKGMAIEVIRNNDMFIDHLRRLKCDGGAEFTMRGHD